MARDTIPITQQVLDHLAALGIAVPHVATDVTTNDYFAFWRELAAKDPRPDLGISIGLAVFGKSVASIAAVQAPTVADAIRTIGRYKRLVCPEEVLLEIGDGEGSVRCDWTLATGDVPAMLVDAVFTSHVALLAKATGGKAKPLRIELARKSRHAQILRAHFKCPIVFGAAYDRMVFSTDTLALPLLSANRAAYEALVPGLEAKLAAKQTLVGSVRVAIARTISAGAQPSIRTIADRLETTARTLQRNLGKANTTFGEQLEDVRRVTARRLLAHTELPNIDIAFLLGYQEPNSFARALRQWQQRK
ncbi:MAG: AraC family transcriptional regulator ligand-binding domain-containing protein [Kofleriaceae bacterium]